MVPSIPIPRPIYVKAIGVELEGGICEERLDEFRKFAARRRVKVSVGNDGSVRVPEPNDVRCFWADDIEIKFMSANPNVIAVLVNKLFELGFRQNETCGNHMHFSFLYNHNHTVSILASWEFIEYYVRRYKAEFGNIKKYMDRLRNGYSRMFASVDDLRHNITGGSRYYAVNFSAFHKHGTLEIRVMPYAESAEEYIRMLTFNLFTIEFYLNIYRGLRPMSLYFDIYDEVADIPKVGSYYEEVEV